MLKLGATKAKKKSTANDHLSMFYKIILYAYAFNGDQIVPYTIKTKYSRSSEFFFQFHIIFFIHTHCCLGYTYAHLIFFQNMRPIKLLFGFINKKKHTHSHTCTVLLERCVDWIIFSFSCYVGNINFTHTDS